MAKPSTLRALNPLSSQFRFHSNGGEPLLNCYNFQYNELTYKIILNISLQPLPSLLSKYLQS